MQYAYELTSLTQKRRREILLKQYDSSSSVTSSNQSTTGSNSDPKKPQQPSAQANQQKNNIYQEKPKLQIIVDFLCQKKENTLIKNYITNSISILNEMLPPQNHLQTPFIQIKIKQAFDAILKNENIFRKKERNPNLNSQISYKRTPYLAQKYNEKFGQFMQNLKEELQQESTSKSQKEMLKELFINQTTNTEFDNMILTNQEEMDVFMSHNIRKQIFCIGEIIDEVTDSLFQNSIYVMENYNLMHFNPAVLAVSYANMKVLDKSTAIVELPKVTFIQLGMNEQEMNKKYLFFNGIDRKEKKRNEIMSNIQYINMYHQHDGRTKQNLQNNGFNLSNGINSHDQHDQDFGSWDFAPPNTNCIEVAINAYLNERKINSENGSLQDLFFADQQKCPKIIGSSEFTYLFESVLKLIKSHKPNIIIFAYDFSFTRAHNHYYDLKVDVLGYFAYMLSQISNHHVLFVANTQYDSHLISSQSQSINSMIGLDGFKSLNNYMNTQKIEGLKKYARDYDIKKNITLLKSTTEKMPDVYMDKIQSQQNQENLQNLLSKISSDVSTPDTVLSKYYKYQEEKFNNIKDNIDNLESELIKDEKFSNDILLHSLNLYQCIEDQFFAVCFALSEIINYRKLMLRYSSKTGNHMDFAFKISLTQQLKRTNNPYKQKTYKELIQKNREKNEWNISQIKVHSYLTKIKQIKHIIGFVYYSNKEKVNLLMDISKQKGYRVTPISEKPSKEEIDQANQDSLIHDIRNQQTSLVDGLSKEQSDILFTEELQVKIMLKRYTSALLNNWIYDLRRNQKIYLNVRVKSTTFDAEFKFFFTDRSQYVIDYDQDNVKIIIYFFNVQRGNVFKNFILTEIGDNIFIQEEIIHQTPLICDFMWKSFMGVQNLSELQIKQTELSKAFELSQNQSQGKNSETKSENENLEVNSKLAQFYTHQELIENLEIYNSTLCLTEKYVVRMFGEIINPQSWKFKEYQLLIFTIPRKQVFQELSENPLMKLINTELVDYPLIHKSVPRSGCTAVSFNQKESEKTQNIVFVFGGLSYNGFLYNVVEEYEVLDSGSLILINQRPKGQSLKTFRPLFCPFTFIHNQEVFFLGGEYGKKLIQKALNQVYFQKYSITDKQFKLVHPLNSKDIKYELILKAQENKKHQQNFLSYLQKVSYSSTNLNSFNNNNTFQFVLIGKINAAIQQILEKTVLISVDINQGMQDQNKSQIPYIYCQTIIEDEKQQELRLCDYKSSQTFFISVFSGESSTFGSTQPKDQSAQASNKPVAQSTNGNQVTSQQTSLQQSKPQQETERIQQQQQLQRTQPVQSVGQNITQNDKQKLNAQLSNQSQSQLKPAGGLIKQINDLSQKFDFPNHPDDGDVNGSALNAQYVSPVNKDIHYSADEKIFYPKYILLQRHHNKLLNFISFENNQLIQKFQTSIRINDEDFKDILLTNHPLFLTYNINFQKKQYNIFKSISLEEAIELNQIFGGRINLTNSLYKVTIKFDQQKLSSLQLQVFDDDLELLQPQLINRYITCDLDYIYLLNGVDYKDQNNVQYNKLSPCERISIKSKTSEQIDPCIYLDTNKSQIISNDLYIYYIGLYENLDPTEMEEEGSDDDDDDSSEILIVQVFSKQINKWKVFQIQNKDILKNFGNFSFQHGNKLNKIFAINTKFTKSKKDQLVNYEISFDMSKVLSKVKASYLSFNWQGQTKISTIPSQFYSATVYTVLATNPIQYLASSMIPISK